MFKVNQWSALIILLVLLIACGGSDSPPPTNNKSNNDQDISLPVANAGSNQLATVDNPVTLNGQAQPDDVPLTYTWEITQKPEGSLASLSNATTASPVFTPDKSGDYAISLIVSDDKAQSKPSTVTITVAAASDCQTNADCNAGNFCNKTKGNCSGTGSCTRIRIADCTTQYTPVCGCDGHTYGNACGAVNNGVNISYDGECVVNKEPIADAGADQTVTKGDTVTLNGSDSRDPEGEKLTYKWTMTQKPSGSQASLSDPSISAPQFTVDLIGIYRASLIINDGALDSPSNEVIITANALACSTNSACSTNEYCKKTDGDCNGIGRCTEKQKMMCTREYKPVCGCDGKTYGNACDAANSSVNISSIGGGC